MILNVLTKSNSDVKSLWTRECVAKKDPKEVTDDDYDEYVYGSIAHMACSVISRAEIEALMNFEVSRQASGCDSEGCLAELGDALGVSRLVIGSAQRVDGATLISLRLVDMEGMRVLKRVTDSTTTDEAVLPFVSWLARRLVAGDDAAGPRPVDDTVVI